MYRDISTDDRVNKTLDVVEAELKATMEVAAQQCSDLLLTKPDDTEPVHRLLNRLHHAMAEIDGNHRRYLTRR